MTSLQLPYDAGRPQASPTASPLPRPSSQASAHTPEMMTYAQPGFRPFQPGPLSLPLPHHSFMNYPSTAPPAPFYPTGMVSHNMMRTVSHAHPMNSATDQTSSRYSASPHSAGDAPPSATMYPLMPSFIFTEPDKHVDPSIFNYSMSRSTSGASDVVDGRLLTPHLDYRQFGMEQDRRPDSMHTKYLPRFEFGMGQPTAFFRGPMSSDREVKAEVLETDYERERAEQIMNNRRLLDDVGLGDSVSNYQPELMQYMRARTQPRKVKRVLDEHPSRVSSRIASMHRTSYADLDGGPTSESDEEEYEELQEEDDFRPPKRTKGKRGLAPRYTRPKVELSLYGLLQVYSQIPHLYPLFYYTLNNDLTINSDSIPLIGSIPSTCTPIEKAASLQDFFHRGRRVLAQLDSFTSRCDRKYEGPMERWSEIDFHTKIAIRDVRRKVVERCENYKYTRRDILDKVLGKNKWQPIEHGLVEWHLGGEGDPANDLQNVTLTLPTPPVYLHPAPVEGRTIRPFPSRSRIASAAPRTVSVQMGYTPTSYPPTPQYGEDQVPMTVQMPGTASGGGGSALTPLDSTWEGGVKGNESAERNV